MLWCCVISQLSDNRPLDICDVGGKERGGGWEEREGGGGGGAVVVRVGVEGAPGWQSSREQPHGSETEYPGS